MKKLAVGLALVLLLAWMGAVFASGWKTLVVQSPDANHGYGLRDTFAVTLTPPPGYAIQLYGWRNTVDFGHSADTLQLYAYYKNLAYTGAPEWRGFVVPGAPRGHADLVDLYRTFRTDSAVTFSMRSSRTGAAGLDSITSWILFDFTNVGPY